MLQFPLRRLVRQLSIIHALIILIKLFIILIIIETRLLLVFWVVESEFFAWLTTPINLGRITAIVDIIWGRAIVQTLCWRITIIDILDHFIIIVLEPRKRNNINLRFLSRIAMINRARVSFLKIASFFHYNEFAIRFLLDLNLLLVSFDGLGPHCILVWGWLLGLDFAYRNRPFFYEGVLRCVHHLRVEIRILCSMRIINILRNRIVEIGVGRPIHRVPVHRHLRLLYTFLLTLLNIPEFVYIALQTIL